MSLPSVSSDTARTDTASTVPQSSSSSMVTTTSSSSSSASSSTVKPIPLPNYANQLPPGTIITLVPSLPPNLVPNTMNMLNTTNASSSLSTVPSASTVQVQHHHPISSSSGSSLPYPPHSNPPTSIIVTSSRPLPPNFVFKDHLGRTFVRAEMPPPVVSSVKDTPPTPLTISTTTGSTNGAASVPTSTTPNSSFASSATIPMVFTTPLPPPPVPFTALTTLMNNNNNVMVPPPAVPSLPPSSSTTVPLNVYKGPNEPSSSSSSSSSTTTIIPATIRPSNGYRGVSFVSSSVLHPWKVTINHAGTSKEIGYFTTETEAAKAYDKEARKLHGHKARLNFPSIGERSTMGRSSFRGISWQPKCSKWEVRIKHQGRMRYLGVYVSEQEAARAWDIECIKLRGIHGIDSKKLNFPHALPEYIRYLQQQNPQVFTTPSIPSLSSIPVPLVNTDGPMISPDNGATDDEDGDDEDEEDISSTTDSDNNTNTFPNEDKEQGVPSTARTATIPSIVSLPSLSSVLPTPVTVSSTANCTMNNSSLPITSTIASTVLGNGTALPMKRKYVKRNTAGNTTKVGDKIQPFSNIFHPSTFSYFPSSMIDSEQFIKSMNNMVSLATTTPTNTTMTTKSKYGSHALFPLKRKYTDENTSSIGDGNGSSSIINSNNDSNDDTIVRTLNETNENSNVYSPVVLSSARKEPVKKVFLVSSDESSVPVSSSSKDASDESTKILPKAHNTVTNPSIGSLNKNNHHDNASTTATIVATNSSHTPLPSARGGAAALLQQQQELAYGFGSSSTAGPLADVYHRHDTTMNAYDPTQGLNPPIPYPSYDTTTTTTTNNTTTNAYTYTASALSNHYYPQASPTGILETPHDYYHGVFGMMYDDPNSHYTSMTTVPPTHSNDDIKMEANATTTDSNTANKSSLSSLPYESVPVETNYSYPSVYAFDNTNATYYDTNNANNYYSSYPLSYPYHTSYDNTYGPRTNNLYPSSYMHNGMPVYPSNAVSTAGNDSSTSAVPSGDPSQSDPSQSGTMIRNRFSNPSTSLCLHVQLPKASSSLLNNSHTAPPPILVPLSLLKDTSLFNPHPTTTNNTHGKPEETMNDTTTVTVQSSDDSPTLPSEFSSVSSLPSSSSSTLSSVVMDTSVSTSSASGVPSTYVMYPVMVISNSVLGGLSALSQVSDKDTTILLPVTLSSTHSYVPPHSTVLSNPSITTASNVSQESTMNT